MEKRIYINTQGLNKSPGLAFCYGVFLKGQNIVFLNFNKLILWFPLLFELLEDCLIHVLFVEAIF